MGTLKDPFIPLAESAADQLTARAALVDFPLAAPALPAAVLARLQGFDLQDQPLVAGLAAAPGEVLPARSTVALKRAHVGAQVLLVFEDGNARRPIITGVLQPASLKQLPEEPEALEARGVTVHVDDERHVVTAEREIVLRCGDASITLTRAGRVIIKGRYILSRSSGYNKIKGAAVDIN